MKTINLFESNELIELKKFAGGECHVKFLTEINEGDKNDVLRLIFKTSESTISTISLTVLVPSC